MWLLSIIGMMRCSIQSRSIPATAFVRGQSGIDHLDPICGRRTTRHTEKYKQTMNK
jgi:hypothetical protein